MGNLANKSSSLWLSLGHSASTSLRVVALLAEVACLGWCFSLTIPWQNTLTTPWQYTGNSLAVPWHYAGNTQALVGRVWMCGISPLTVTSLEQQQCMGSCQLLHEMHADTVRAASPWSRAN